MSAHATGVAEHAEMIEMARELARHELAPRAAALDAGEESAFAQCWRALVEVGLDRALIGEELGGAGIGLADLLAVLEELATGDGGVALSVLLCNAALCALPPERVASMPAGARWALVPAQPGVQADGRNGRPGAVSLVGLGAWKADGIVFAFGDGRLLSRAAAAEDPPLQVEREQAQLGLRGAPAAVLRLTVGGAEGLGDGGGDPFALLREGIAAIAFGIARRARELAYEYALQRRQGGVAIIEHDAVSDMLSAMTVRLGSRACADRRRSPGGAGRGAPGAPNAADAIVAKVLASDAAVATSTDAVQVFGGTGYMRETGVEKLMRDAKCCQLFPEPNWVAQDELMRLSGDRGR